MTVDDRPAAGVEADVRALEAQRYAAMECGDVDMLEGLLADDLRYTHSDASTDSKADYLARVRDGTFDYGPIEHSLHTVTVLGDAALAFGEMRTVARVRGTAKQIHNIGLSVWVCDGERWRLAVYQPTAVPGVTVTSTD